MAARPLAGVAEQGRGLPTVARADPDFDPGDVSLAGPGDPAHLEAAGGQDVATPGPGDQRLDVHPGDRIERDPRGRSAGGTGSWASVGGLGADAGASSLATTILRTHLNQLLAASPARSAGRARRGSPARARRSSVPPGSCPGRGPVQRDAAGRTRVSWAKGVHRRPGNARGPLPPGAPPSRAGRPAGRPTIAPGRRARSQGTPGMRGRFRCPAVSAHWNTAVSPPARVGPGRPA